MKILTARFNRMSKRRQKIQLKKQVKGVLMQFAGRKYEPSLQVEMVAALQGLPPPPSATASVLPHTRGAPCTNFLDPRHEQFAASAANAFGSGCVAAPAGCQGSP